VAAERESGNKAVRVEGHRKLNHEDEVVGEVDQVPHVEEVALDADLAYGIHPS
jgi:hypothetical protein